MEAGAGSGTGGVRSSWRSRVAVPSPDAPLALLRRAGAGAQGHVGSALGALRAQWNRSLQLRVVGTTLIFSAVVIATLGFFLLQQIASGLVQNKERSAATLAADGVRIADNQLALQPSVPPSAPGAGGLMYQIPQTLIGQVQAVQGAGGSEATSEPTTLNLAGGGSVPGLAIGAPLHHEYQLYYLFPLTTEQQTLALFQRAIIAVGLALVFLLAAIASLVTRWVVVPVRQAARGAQRLSTGNLSERMEVRGTDDLAALATSFNEMAASLAEKMTELQELSLVQRQFVSDVSHELRTPLTTIRIAADVLYASRQGLDAASGRSAELLQGQLERFESLLADLLEISRYDANAATLDPEPVDICDVVRNSADVAQQLAERRGTKIQFQLPAGPCVAEVDSRRVARILRNLLANAVEHGEDKDAVVTVAADRDAVAIAVRDFGVGLAPGEATLVFDRFWRADPSRARTSGGTGLGLAIALEDALLHGGWLEAWGEPGRGSVFQIGRASCRERGARSVGVGSFT